MLTSATTPPAARLAESGEAVGPLECCEPLLASGQLGEGLTAPGPPLSNLHPERELHRRLAAAADRLIVERERRVDAPSRRDVLFKDQP